LGFLYKVHAGLGIDPKQVLTANIRLEDSQYRDPSTQAAFFRQAIERLEALPGVVSAGGATTLVPVEQARVVTFSIGGQAILPRTERPKANYFAITPRFLATLRVPVLRGRSFDLHDSAQAPPVAVVNEAFVRRFLPSDDPLGKRVRLDTDDSERQGWSEIVGVVRNVEESYEEWEERPQVYESYLQRPAESMTLVVRTTSDPGQFAPLLRRAIWSLDKDQPVHRVQTMEQVIADYRRAGGLVTTLMGSYAALALAMAMVGVFGVMAYTVAQRTHEIGIRMALGARRDDVVRTFAKKGFALGALGVGIGLAFAAPLVLLAPRAGIGMPFEQRLAVALAATVLVWLAAALASYIPVRRATRVDPMVALRYE
jgi:putative ABC transport system permease protein